MRSPLTRGWQPPEPHVLREYALLADGERGALLGPRGEVAWLCAPRWDSPAVFSTLLGGAGCYQVAPAGRFVWGGWYEPGTLVWHSRWVLDDGLIVESEDALALPSNPGCLVLLRRIRASGGSARMDAVLDLRAGFDQHSLTDLRRDDAGRWTGRAGDVVMRWQATPAASAGRHGGADVLGCVMEIPAGGTCDLVLEIGTELGEPVAPDVAWQTTRAGWAAKAPPMPDAWSPPHARHSLAVLHGLTAATGAMVAAATMSLPERAHADHDYDYRYAWIRDQCYSGYAAYAAGSMTLGDAAVRFTTERLLADGPSLAPAYTVTGQSVPEQAEVALPGYPGGRAVSGNQVRSQFQLDTFGEILHLLACAQRHDRLDDDAQRAARVAVSAIASRWQEPEAGLWELEPACWTHSRLAAVAGLRAWAAAHATGATLSRTHGTQGEDPLALADGILAHVAATCRHPSGRWQRAPDDERVDAALILGALRGAVPLEDPRSVATLAAVQEELDVDGYVFRFRHDARPLPSAEGAFLLCSYWTALAEAQMGQHARAISRMEKALAACGPPVLFSEEYDPVQHQMRGNLPQAFVHALALEACVRLPVIMGGAAAGGH